MNTHLAVRSLLCVVTLAVFGWPAAPVQSALVAEAPGPAAQAAGLWYVAPTGQDTNDCATPATPCATINGGIGKADSGGTVRIAIGTYNGPGERVVRVDKDVTLSGGWRPDFEQPGWPIHH